MSSYVTKFFAFILGIKKPTEVGSKSGKRDASMKSLSLPRFNGDREKLRWVMNSLSKNLNPMTQIFQKYFMLILKRF
jgi:hypothetical protein